MRGTLACISGRHDIGEEASSRRWMPHFVVGLYIRKRTCDALLIYHKSKMRKLPTRDFECQQGPSGGPCFCLGCEIERESIIDVFIEARQPQVASGTILK